MNANEAIKQMIPPSQVRQGKPRGGVVQIHTTRLCDESCYNCTQGSNLKGPYHHITVDNFEEAVVSLMTPEPYFGTIGVFGGNPALHPEFEQLCLILQKHVPQRKCGLWCNNPKGHGRIMARTFNPALSNLNVHLSQQAYDEFRRDWPESRPFGLDADSRHSPVFVAMSDVISSEEERWEKIANCDINKHWSAMVAQFRGELRAWFCEIAGAQSILHQDNPDYPDTGVPVEPGWWKRPIEDYEMQIRIHCHECSVPLRGYGSLAQAADDDPDAVEMTSALHASVYRPKNPKRPVKVVESLDDLNTKDLKFTDYLGGAKQ